MKKGPLTQMKLSFAPKRSAKSSATTKKVEREGVPTIPRFVAVPASANKFDDYKPAMAEGLNGAWRNGAWSPVTGPFVFNNAVEPFVRTTPIFPPAAPTVARVSLPFACKPIGEPGMVDADATPAQYQQQMAASGKAIPYKKESTSMPPLLTKPTAVGGSRHSVEGTLEKLALVDTLLYVHEKGNVPGFEGLVGVNKAPGPKKANAARVVYGAEDIAGKHRSKINKGLEYAYKIACAEGHEGLVKIVKGLEAPSTLIRHPGLKSFVRPIDALVLHRHDCERGVHLAAEMIADIVGERLLLKFNSGFTPYKGVKPLQELKDRASSMNLTMRDLDTVLEKMRAQHIEP